MRLRLTRVRRRSRTWLALFVVALGPAAAQAQANNGALDLLVPIGARATAMGTAYVGEQGSESIWWNPAGLARMTKPEFAIDHFANVFITGGDAVSLILPAGPVGVFGLSARLFTYDSTAITLGPGEELGVARPRSVALGASFAAPFGPRLSAGLSFRVYQSSLSCTGSCAKALALTFTTSTVDAGVQFRPSLTVPLQIAVLISDVGPNLQAINQPQADALPARVHLGVSYRPTFPDWDPGLRVVGTAELVATPAFSSRELLLGGELGYMSGATLLSVRAGYVAQGSSSGGAGTGPSIGLGLASGRVQLDLARIFETFSSGLGVPPTYISIRVGL